MCESNPIREEWALSWVLLMCFLKNDSVVDELQTCPFLKISELMDLCVTEDRGIACTYCINLSVRTKEYL